MSQELDSTGELLTLQDAAERLKVHYMTAYRWVRRGDLPAFKAGGRLRVRSDDIERFVQQRRVDVLLPDPSGRTDWPTHLDRFYGLLSSGRALEANHLVRKVIADGAPAGQVYLELLTPALHRVGDAWAGGSLTVADEHRASEICRAIISRLSDSFRRRGPSRGTAVTLTPPDEQHGIAAAMAADFLRVTGYDVHHLGVNVPVADLHTFLQVVPCDVLCVSITTPVVDQRTYVDLLKAADQGSAGVVIFGGQGTDAETAESVGAIHLASLGDIVPRLEALAV